MTGNLADSKALERATGAGESPVETGEGTWLGS
jgi:hypothetical protein